MAREAMDVCLRVLKESKKCRFDSYSVGKLYRSPITEDLHVKAHVEPYVKCM